MPDRASGDRRDAVLLNQRQELERGARRPLLTPLPFAHEVRRHIEVIREHRLAHVLSFPESLYLFRR